MPGIAEEFVIRVVFISLLIVALGGSLNPDEKQFVWSRENIFSILITSLCFALAHNLLTYNEEFHFDGQRFFGMFVYGGIVFGWLRVYTGSVILPILAHNIGNLIFFYSYRLLGIAIFGLQKYAIAISNAS